VEEIIDKTIPAWYELDGDERYLQITVPCSVAEFVKKIIKLPNQLIDLMTKKLSLPKFVPPIYDDWGFGNVVTGEQKDNSVTWKIRYPVGSGKNFITDQTSRTQFFSISASLQILFHALNCNTTRTNSVFPQFLALETSINLESMNDFGVRTVLSPHISRWLSKQPNNSNNQEIASSMKKAYSTMCECHSPLDRFEALVRHPGRIDLTCPGDRCGLNPDDWCEANCSQGYYLLGHNLDTPVQQLTLIAGLVKLYQLTKRDFLNNSS